MRIPAALSRFTAAAILSRLALVLGLLLGDLIPDPRAGGTAALPAGAADLFAATNSAILPAEAARIATALTQQDDPDALPRQGIALSIPFVIASSTPPGLTPAWPPRTAHLRPFPHGPPAA